MFMGCVMGRVDMAFRSYSVLNILLPSIIIIVQDYSQALNTYEYLWGISWRCVKHAASPVDFLFILLQYIGLYVFTWPISV